MKMNSIGSYYINKPIKITQKFSNQSNSIQE